MVSETQEAQLARIEEALQEADPQRREVQAFGRGESVPVDVPSTTRTVINMQQRGRVIE